MFINVCIFSDYLKLIINSLLLLLSLSLLLFTDLAFSLVAFNTALICYIKNCTQMCERL